MQRASAGDRADDKLPIDRSQIIGGHGGTRTPTFDRQRSCRWRLGNSDDARAVSSTEADLATFKVLDARATLVNEAVVSSAEAHEVGELGFAAINPVFDVVAIDNGVRAARKSAAIIAERQRAVNRGWNGSRLATNVDGLAGLIAQHWDQARIAE